MVCCAFAAAALGLVLAVLVGRSGGGTTDVRIASPLYVPAVWRPPRSPAILKGNCRRRSFSARIRTL
jgi:hypothetical protein